MGAGCRSLIETVEHDATDAWPWRDGARRTACLHGKDLQGEHNEELQVEKSHTQRRGRDGLACLLGMASTAQATDW